MKKTEQIKKELRRIRKLSHVIEASTKARERLENRRKLLEKAEQSEKSKLEIEKIERVISSLNVEHLIAESTELEERYIKAISTFPPLDQVIIIDSYINGLTYWQIGRKIGYSESGVKRRIKKVVERLADII